MENGAIKNRMMFFGTAIVSVIAIFIFSMIIAPAPEARAYAVSPIPSSTTTGYDPTSALENLFTPFTGFFKSLQFSNNTTINTQGDAAPLPTMNLAPGLESGAQNILSQWLGEFNDWFYKVTGVKLSGIFYVLLNAISWTLGLAQRAVNWLLGLFH